MKSFALLILMIGVIFITIGVSKEKSLCPANKIEYRFIPRTFYDEQTSRIPSINSQFKDMFNEPSAWEKAAGGGKI